MNLPVMILQATIMSLLSGCSAQDNSSAQGKSQGHHESDAIRNWGAQMLDDQTTYYQDLYLSLTKLAPADGQQELDSTKIKFSLVGSSLEATLVRDRVNAHFCEIDKQEKSSVCEYKDLSLSELSPVAEENSEAGLAGVFEILRSDLSLVSEMIRLRVSYCEVTCATTYLEFSLQDGEVSNSNREPLSGASTQDSPDETIITQ